MTKSVIITVVVCMFAASGVSYGAAKNAAANANMANVEKVIDAGLKDAANQAAQAQDKARWGDLKRHQKRILEKIYTDRPKCTQVVNLGRYAIEPVANAWEYHVNNYKYLIEATVDGDVYYYDVVVTDHLTLVEHKWCRQESVQVYSMSQQAAEKAKQSIK